MQFIWTAHADACTPATIRLSTPSSPGFETLGMPCTKPYAMGWWAAAYFLVIVVFGALVLPTVLIGVVTVTFQEAQRIVYFQVGESPTVPRTLHTPKTLTLTFCCTSTRPPLPSPSSLSLPPTPFIPFHSISSVSGGRASESELGLAQGAPLPHTLSPL